MAQLLHQYPEQNPWELNPRPLNLVPCSPMEQFDTQAFLDAALEMAEQSAINPLSYTYGPNPFALHDENLMTADLPLTEYMEPPPLHPAELSDKIEFLEEINPDGNTPVLKVRIGEDIRLLKVFPDRPVSMEKYWKPQDAPPHPLIRFEREKATYAHLVHYGACDKGAVPQCYGWLELSPEDLDNIELVPNASVQLARANYRKDPSPPKCLLLQYFENAQPVSIDNVTIRVANRALRALYRVQASYIKHGDMSRRNILVLPNEHVVLLDFDSANYVGRDDEFPLRRQSLLLEMASTWTLFYTNLLPDKRIGFRSSFY